MKMKNMSLSRRIVPVIAIGVLACMSGLGNLWAQDGFIQKVGSDCFAKIEYPAKDNVELNEGTYELWFQVILNLFVRFNEQGNLL